MKDFKKYLDNSMSKEHILVYCNENSTPGQIRRGIRRGLEEHLEELMEQVYHTKIINEKLLKALGETLDKGIKQ